jgi:hypothetical protein
MEIPQNMAPGLAYGGRIVLELPGIVVRKIAKTGELDVVATRDFRAGDLIAAEWSIAASTNVGTQATGSLLEQLFLDAPLGVALLAPRDPARDHLWAYRIEEFVRRAARYVVTTAVVDLFIPPRLSGCPMRKTSTTTKSHAIAISSPRSLATSSRCRTPRLLRRRAFHTSTPRGSRPAEAATVATTTRHVS